MFATGAEAHASTMAKVYAEARANNYTFAEAKAMAYAETKAMETHTDYKASAKALATDCLRLSMHFFHPIQQCAQQVYHTAIPLSPTSSWLHKSWLPSIIDNQLSCVAVFSGAPNTWGSLLRTIDVRPSQLTCIATSAQRIISACKDNVNIYDAVTFVLRQSISTPETVTKIQDSPDGSILFFAHTFSATMWDVQTGGLIHTFPTQSKINDIAISTTHIACGTSNGSVEFWNIDAGGLGRGFRAGNPVITIHWLSFQELAVATQSVLYICNVTIGETLGRFAVPGHVWGMVYLEYRTFLVGTSQPSSGAGQEESFFIRCQQPELQLSELNLFRKRFMELVRSSVHTGQLSNPIPVADKVVCISPTNGVQLFDTRSNDWAKSPPLLGAAASVAVSLNRNLVVQTKDSVQIFSVDVLKSGKIYSDVHLSHIYPLGGDHIICIQSTRHLTLLELGTMQELHHDDNTSLLRSSLTGQSASAHDGLVAEFGVSAIMQAWQSGIPLPERASVLNEDTPLRGWSPESTWMVAFYNLPQPELCVIDTKTRITLVNLPLEDTNLGMGEAYDITFNSETSFYLKIDGPGWHVQIPYNITVSPSEHYTLTQGKPAPLSEPQPTLPYSLDANCEWVLDAKSRKICWISPGDIRRGDGGHFWAGLSLVMVGDDGVVKKLTFKEPDC